MRRHQKDPVRRLFKIIIRAVREAVEAEENAEKDRMDNQDKRKGGARDEIQTTVPAHKNGDKSLVLLQVNCRSIYNKVLEFWNLVDTSLSMVSLPCRRLTPGEMACVAK